MKRAVTLGLAVGASAGVVAGILDFGNAAMYVEIALLTALGVPVVLWPEMREPALARLRPPRRR